MYIGFELRASLPAIWGEKVGRYFELGNDLESAKECLSHFYSELREKYPRAKLLLVVFSPIKAPNGEVVPLLSDYYPDQYTELDAIYRALEYFYIGML